MKWFINNIRQFFIDWYTSKTTDTLYIILATGFVFGFCQFAKWLDVKFAEDTIEVIFYYIFDVLSWPSRIATGVSILMFIIQGTSCLWNGFRNMFGT